MPTKGDAGDLGGRGSGPVSPARISGNEIGCYKLSVALKATLHGPHSVADQRRNRFYRRIFPEERRDDEAEAERAIPFPR